MDIAKGMTVDILANCESYGGRFAGRTGVVAMPRYGNHTKIGVLFIGARNPDSKYGYYYFAPHEIKVRQPESTRELINTFAIKNVYFNDPVTVVMWEDGTKTVVRCGKNDIYDPEKGLAMAVTKKALGNKGNYYNEFKKWMPTQRVKDTSPKVPVRMSEGNSEDDVLICCDDCKYNGTDVTLEPCRSCLSSGDYCSKFMPRDF